MLETPGICSFLDFEANSVPQKLDKNCVLKCRLSNRLMRLLIESKRVVVISLYTHPHPQQLRWFLRSLR